MKHFKKNGLHILAFLIVFSFLAPVSGVRHLWQDEIETAERARSILFYGVPEVVDPEGRLSLNAGGREIEDGDLHRYTPWGQFYVGASGIAVGRILGLSDDAGVRIPFVALHAATSMLLSYGLVACAQWPVAIAFVSASFFGLQSVRVLNNRSCRYHAALDFLFVLGLLAIGLRERRPKISKALSGISIFLLPQMHTLGGGVLASTLVVISLVKAILGSDQKLSFRLVVQAFRREFWPSVFPALASVALIAVLCRPWAQGAWSAVTVNRTWASLRSTLEIAYSFYVLGAFLLLLAWKRDLKTALGIALVAGWIFSTVTILDLHPFSQTRYYLSVPIFCLFWIVAWGFPPALRKQKPFVWALVGVGILLPDLQGIIRPWEGVRVVVSDYVFRRENKKQPLRLALESLHSLGGASDSVLIDYVPQFANWYLRSAKIAMIPDPSGRTRLNANNALYATERRMPEWHLFYERQNGYWTCADKCSFHRSGLVDGRYALSFLSNPGGQLVNIEFCVVSSWKVSRWNNAPFVGYNSASTSPEGPVDDVLFLARKCSK